MGFKEFFGMGDKRSAAEKEADAKASAELEANAQEVATEEAQKPMEEALSPAEFKAEMKKGAADVEAAQAAEEESTKADAATGKVFAAEMKSGAADIEADAAVEEAEVAAAKGAGAIAELGSVESFSKLPESVRDDWNEFVNYLNTDTKEKAVEALQALFTSSNEFRKWLSEEAGMDLTKKTADQVVTDMLERKKTA